MNIFPGQLWCLPLVDGQYLFRLVIEEHDKLSKNYQPIFIVWCLGKDYSFFIDIPVKASYWSGEGWKMAE